MHIASHFACTIYIKEVDVQRGGKNRRLILYQTRKNDRGGRDTVFCDFLLPAVRGSFGTGRDPSWGLCVAPGSPWGMTLSGWCRRNRRGLWLGHFLRVLTAAFVRLCQVRCRVATRNTCEDHGVRFRGVRVGLVCTNFTADGRASPALWEFNSARLTEVTGNVRLGIHPCTRTFHSASGRDFDGTALAFLFHLITL